MAELVLYDEYSREDVHRIFSPDTQFIPQAGTWGLQGVVSIPDRIGDYVFFVTFGQKQGEHTSDEGITDEGGGSVAARPQCDDTDDGNFIPPEPDDRLMAKRHTLRFLCPMMLYFFSAIQASAADAWDEDFRRCRVLKKFSQGTVVISADEKMLELDVQWDDGGDLDNLGAADISVQIDNAPLPNPKPLKSDTGIVYGFTLGSFDAILPALSRGKRLQISISGKPERSVDLNIGTGGKAAVAFLRKCDMYWTNFHIATNAWERGRASAKVGEHARAIEDFDQAIQKFPKEYTTKRARILFERGQAKLRKGDKAGGNADIMAATKLRRWIATMDDINP